MNIFKKKGKDELLELKKELEKIRKNEERQLNRNEKKYNDLLKEVMALNKQMEPSLEEKRESEEALRRLIEEDEQKRHK